MPSNDVVVPSAGARLGATLSVPDGTSGLVVFAHGSGSSRHSPRNRAVAEVLWRAGIATLLLDLLSGDEERESTQHRLSDLTVDQVAEELGRSGSTVRGWLAAAEFPNVRVVALEQYPSPHNPLGAKGLAEAGNIGAPPTIVNAVLDALARVHDLEALARELARTGQLRLDRRMSFVEDRRSASPDTHRSCL